MKKLYTIVLFLKIVTCFVLQRNFGNIIHDVAQRTEGQVSKADLRRLEKLRLKVNKAELDLNFLRNCKNFNVAPKFLTYTLPNASSHDIKAIRKRLLRGQIQTRCKERAKLQREYDKVLAELVPKLSSVDLYIIKKAITRNVNNDTRKVTERHERKLRDLTKDISLPFRSDETVTNLSSYTPTQEELEVLKHGLSYAIQPARIDKTDVFASFELIHRFMKENICCENEPHAAELRSKLSHLANSYITTYKPRAAALKTHRVLTRLKRNKNIVILKPDKGNATVIINTIMI